MRKLPVFKTVKEVLSGVTVHYFQLLLAAWPAAILLLVCAAMLWPHFGSLSEAWVAMEKAQAQGDPKAASQFFATAFSGGRALYLIVIWLLAFLASVIAAVRWHRLVLFGEGADLNVSKIAFMRSEDARYIWTCIKIGLLMIPIMIAYSVIFGLLVVGLNALGLHTISHEHPEPTPLFITIMMLSYLVLLYFMLRLGLALPDAAVGQKGRIFKMLAISESNALRLLINFILISLVTFAISIGFASLIGESFWTFSVTDIWAWGGVPAMVFYVAIYLFGLMTQITLLSVAYREIIGLPGEAAPEPAADDLRIEPV